MSPWTWRWWRIARGNDDGTLIVDANGEWFRMFGRIWWLGLRSKR